MNNIAVKPYSRIYLEQIDEIWRRHYSKDFSLPNLNNTVTSLVATRGDRLIAFGMIKLFAEAVMVLDKDAPIRDKVMANDLLLAQGFEDARDNRLEQMHVAVDDDTYRKLLENKYNFKPVSKPLLVKEL